MTRADRFSGIIEFVETARRGSFTAAAASLGVTKSAIGKSLDRLELRLGTRLFHRTTRRLSLTTDGETYLAACNAMAGELDSAENEIGAGLLEPIGQVRVDLPGAFGRLYVVPLLISLMSRRAGLSVNASFTDRRVDLIDERIDVAVRIGPPPDTTELAARRVGTQTLVICAAPDYLDKHGAPERREDLANHRCITGRRNRVRHAWLLRNRDGSTERYLVDGTYQFEDGEAMLQAAVAGLGLAQLPTWLAVEQFASGVLLPVLPGISGGHVPITAIWRNTRPIPLRVQVVVETLGQGLAEQSVLHPNG